MLALKGEFVAAINLAAAEASATVQPFMQLVERHRSLPASRVASSTRWRSARGQIADYDCRVLTLPLGAC